jgi:hypothetical protein
MGSVIAVGIDVMLHPSGLLFPVLADHERRRPLPGFDERGSLFFGVLEAGRFIQNLLFGLFPHPFTLWIFPSSAAVFIRHVPDTQLGVAR